MDSKIHDRIKKLRKMAGKTQQEFSDSIEIHQTTLSTIENGGLPSIETIYKIREVYNIPADWILNFINLDDKILIKLIKKEAIMSNEINGGVVMEQTIGNGNGNKQVLLEIDCEKEKQHLLEKVGYLEKMLQDKDKYIAVLEKLAGIDKKE